MEDVRRLLDQTAAIAADYLESLGDRRVFPDVTPEQLRAALGGPLPEHPVDARQVVGDWRPRPSLASSQWAVAVTSAS